MRLKRLSSVLAAMALAACIAVPAFAVPTEFLITVHNYGPQPLSPVFFSASDSTFQIFNVGSPASLAIKSIAEMGDVSGLVGEATTNLGGSVAGYTVVHSGSPMTPGTTASSTLMADSGHAWLSYASMLGLTNDGFIGGAVGNGNGGINLFAGGVPLTADFTVSFLNAWDAGTEANTQNKADLAAFGGTGNPPDSIPYVHGPHPGIIPGVGDATLPNWYGHDIATITIAPVPEPSGLLALGAGMMGFAGLLFKRR